MKESALTSSNRLGGAVISDRIVASLLEELRTGRYARADRLPAEVDLAAELGVSRTVIRDALSEMERAGYVERVRGIGTVVNRAVLSLRSRLDQKLEYYPLIRSFGTISLLQLSPTQLLGLYIFHGSLQAFTSYKSASSFSYISFCCLNHSARSFWNRFDCPSSVFGETTCTQ